jgi:hypothetical protein
MQNQGLDLSYITNLSASYNASPIVASFNNCVTLADAADGNPTTPGPNKTLVMTIGAESIPGMLGVMPGDHAGALGATNTLTGSALSQAGKIFPSGDISSFVQNFGKSSAAASSSNDLLQAAQALAKKGWSEFGGGIKKLSDVATCGLGRLSQVSGTGLKELGEQLSKLGSSENVAELTAAKNQFASDYAEFSGKMGNSVNSAVNFIQKGAGSVGDLSGKLAAAGLPVDERLADFANNQFAVSKVTGILDSINVPKDIESLKSKLDVNIDLPIGKASDLLDPTKAVPQLKNFLDTEVFQQLPGVLNGIPGSDAIQDPGVLGKVLQQLRDVPNSAALDALPNFVQPSDLANLESFFPSIDDADTGITTQDLIGVVAGGKFGTILAAAKKANDEIANSPQAQTIATLLSQLAADLSIAGAGDWTTTIMDPTPGHNRTITDYKTLIEAQMTSIITSGNGLLTQLAGTLGDDWSEGARKISNQISGLSKMNIDLTQVSAGNKMALIGFGRSLGDLAKQPGNEEILANLCADNEVGQAIKLHVIEKQNLEILQKFGLNPPNIFPFP